MRTCPNCTTELVVDGGERCPVCDALLSEAPRPAAGVSDDDTPFEVTEAHDDSRELIGGSGRKTSRDDLGVENDADVMARQSGAFPKRSTTTEHRSGLDDEQIPPPQGATALGSAQRQNPTDSGSTAEKPDKSRLSAKEIESISKNLYGNQSYLSEREKRDLLKKVDSSIRPGSPTTPHPEPVEADSARPKAAKRVRGVAWYYRNWIQVVGEHNLCEHEEIVINDRPFLLRKKKFSPKLVIAALSPVAAVILFFLGSALTTSISGKGRIVGVVADQFGRPLSQPAKVRLPDLNQTVTTNAQGFFITDPVKGGSHKVEYVVNGQVVGSDYATVVPNEITTLKLAPATTQQAATPESSSSPGNLAEPARQSGNRATQPDREVAQRPTSIRQPERGAGDDQQTADPNARLLLDADVEGATLSLNDRVIGAGNLNYSRLQPGRYDYEVSKDGYKSVKGTVDLSAGKTTSLTVQLSQHKSPSKSGSAPEQEHFEAAMAAVTSSDFATAEQEFGLAIQAKPSYTAAHMGLADLKTKTGRPVEASQDYLRAAEIYRVAGDLGNALKAYNGAVQTDKSSGAALAGRGNLYLAKGEQIAAIADFEQLITVDRRNTQGYLGLGMARFSQGNPKQAIKHFKDARSTDPKNIDVHEYLMLCYFATDNLKDAKKSYEDFMDVANAAQVKDLKQNPKFGAVLRVVGE